MWDTVTGKVLLTLRVNAVGQPSNRKWPRYAAFSAAFTPDGSRLALANPESGDVKIWDVATGKEPLPMDRGLGRASGYSLMTPFLAGLVFSSDGKLLSAAGFDATVKVWDAGTGQLRNNFKGHTGIIAAVGFSRDRTRIWSASLDGTIRVWDATASDQLAVLAGASAMALQGSKALSADGKLIAAVIATGPKGKEKIELKAWDTATGKALFSLGLTSDPFRPVAISPRGERVAAVVEIGEEKSTRRGVRVWDTATGNELFTVDGGFQGAGPLIFSPDGEHLAAWVSFGGKRKPPFELRVWDAVTGKELLAINGSPYVMLFSLAFSSDSKRLAAVSSYTEYGKPFWGVKEWDTATGKQLLTWKVPSSRGVNVAFSPNSQRILLIESTSPAADNLCEFKLVDYATGKELRTWKGRIHMGFLGVFSQMVYSPDGRRVAVVAPSGTNLLPAYEVKVLDAITGQERHSLKLGSVGPVVFSPDGKRLVTGSSYEVFSWRAKHADVKVWDVDTGVDLLTLKWRPLLSSITFSSDGNRLVLVGNVFKGPFVTPMVQVVDGTPLPEKGPADGGPP